MRPPAAILNGRQESLAAWLTTCNNAVKASRRYGCRQRCML